MQDQVDILIKNLDIVFRRIQPEKIFTYLSENKHFVLTESNQESFSARGVPDKPFRQIAQSVFPMMSSEETACIYNMMQGIVHGEKRQYKIPEYAAVFRLILDAGRKMLNYADNRLFCKFEYVLSWDQLYRLLGQDLFTTARLAYHDFERNQERQIFLWEPVLITDHHMLHQCLSKGIAENHMHLGGSSQSFPVMWAYLMNHPREIRDMDGQLSGNLQPVQVYGASDNLETWETRLQKAALIRAALTMQLHGDSLDDYLKRMAGSVFNKRDNGDNPSPNEASRRGESVDIIGILQRSFNIWGVLDNLIDELRFNYGMPIPQDNEKYAVIDYALGKDQMEAQSHHNRLLSGERSWMYHCFLAIFSGEWKANEANAFYLYLLIKSNIRSEFIQANQKIGFKNFKDYQDRKSMLYEKDQSYLREMVRLAINGNLSDYPIQCLEARIAPKATYREIREQIYKYDRAVISKGPPNVPFYYVFHFIKQPDVMIVSKKAYPIMPKFIAECRNAKARKAARQSALSIRTAIELYPEIRPRILGIDAASIEIGCPPEVFASEFRMLRGWIPHHEHQRFLTCGRKPATIYRSIANQPVPPTTCAANRLQSEPFLPMKNTITPVNDMPEHPLFHTLGITYHAGEDFLDLIDGLRTIDEAVRFLPLRRCDRIGHALALGVEPSVHYQTKGNRSVLPKQTLLDNMVWILHRAAEMDIPIRGALEQRFRLRAEQLLDELYGHPYQDADHTTDPEQYDETNEPSAHHDDTRTFTLTEYYHSWMLRADPPEWYQRLRYQKPRDNFLSKKDDQSIPEDSKLNAYRRAPNIARMYGLYHYSDWVKTKGAECVEIPIDEEYMQLVRAFQEKMQCELSMSGIMIECNPTSNFLIGTFRDYSQHPIFRFYQMNKEREDDAHRLKVSINTDDLGVFDTSLENEYVMVAAALSKKRGTNGERLFSDVRIEEYVDQIRAMGLEQSFIRRE